MISREWTEPVIVAGVEEWHRGRESDPTLAPQGVPDLSVVPGYSLDDVRYNCVGRQSPAQARQAKKTLLGQLGVIGVTGAFVAFMLAHGGGIITFIALISIGVAGLKAVFLFQEIWAGHVAQVDGDIWTELQRDSESADRFFVHIDDLRLEITKRAYGVLTAGGPYRIYYLLRAKRAVGGQVLPAWRPLPQPKPQKRSWWSRIFMETPEPQSRPTLFRRLAILVGFGVVSSVATGCSPATSSPSPSASPGLPYSTLQGVTCADANDCWAVGYTGFAGIAAANTLIEHYAGSSWAIVSTPSPIEGQLNEVTCVSAGDCWAVGSTPDDTAVGGSYAQPRVVRYTGSGWAIVSTPNRGPSQLSGVTCGGVGGCWAVGSLYATGSPPLIEHYTGTGWAISTPDPSPGFSANVACPSVGECWAVGSLIERYAGSRWTVVSNAALSTAPGTGSGALEAVTCAGANDCWAVGTSGDLASGGQTLISHYSGSSWTIFGRQ